MLIVKVASFVIYVFLLTLCSREAMARGLTKDQLVGSSIPGPYPCGDHIIDSHGICDDDHCSRLCEAEFERYYRIISGIGKCICFNPSDHTCYCEVICNQRHS
ncbi:unnamed protein product [Urochloa decumbens]|uniref:Uncharacterized protein n=1 Tax=Urochloa decumbens TaxID=240449 RepID=A0ABC9FEZ3_9POAL